MGEEVKHLCLVRFKEGVVAEDILRELADVAAGIDAVRFFGWGEDTASPETLTQGFTHALSMAFATAEDMAAFTSHEKHAAFAPTFMAAVDKLLVMDFPFVLAKCEAVIIVLYLQYLISSPALLCCIK